jgi:hypothetical protein
MSKAYRTLTTSSPAVEIDPSAPGTFARYAYPIEGSLNIFGATAMLLYPSSLLSCLVASPSYNTPAAGALLQWIGALTVGLTPQLFLAWPNTRGALESRRMVYYTLGAGEVALVGLFLWQGFKDGRVEMGLSNKGLMVCAGNLIGPLIMRAYVLFWRPELLGRYREADGKKNE